MSSRASLRVRMARILEEGFTALDIAEPLPSFEKTRSAAAVRDVMKARNLSVVGIRDDACLTGYVRPEDLDGAATCGEAAHSLTEVPVLSNSASLPEVIRALDTAPFCFVSVLGVVSAFVSRNDIDKPPVRMWLFGIVTILDMYITRKIDESFPDESWTSILAPGRLEKALALREERTRRNQPNRLLDCLQLTDKAYILMHDDAMMKELRFTSRREGRRALKAFESLRNNLAHVQSLVAYDWETIVSLANRVDTILSRI